MEEIVPEPTPAPPGPTLEEALAALEHLEDAEPAQHVAAFETVHRLLQQRLAEAES